jgi:hypothetical protein
MTVVVPHLGKTLAALGMLLFFTLGGFAVSLAHDSPMIGRLHTIELRSAHTFAPAQQDRYTLRFAMDFEAGGPPKFSELLSEPGGLSCLSLSEPGTISGPSHVPAAKVPLQKMKSVLQL